jgi:predicted NBD/HSP70 family sugar kinase
LANSDLASSNLAIGVDIGGTKVLGGVVDTNGSILRTLGKIRRVKVEMRSIL